MKDLIEQFKRKRESIEEESTIRTSECVECGKTFQHYYKGKRGRKFKTCSKECRRIRKNRLRNERRDKKREVMRVYAEKNNLTERTVNHYGIDLLESNKELKESLQVIHMVNGRKNLPDEARRVREGLRKKPADYQHKRYNGKVKPCKNCGEDFRSSIKHKTYCSDECRDNKQKELNRNRNIKYKNK